MSTTQVTTLEERLSVIAEKSGKPIEEVKKIYDDAIIATPKNVKSEKRRENLALMIVNKELLVNTKSSAVTFEGIILGAEKTKDLMERKRERALKAAEDNLQEALDDNLVIVENDRIIPIDNREEVNGEKNKKFRQPLKEHMYLRKLHVIAKKPEDSSYILTTMSLWNDQSKLTIPVLKYVSFKANGDTEEGLRSSVDTQFDIQDGHTAEQVVGIIDEVIGDDFKTLKDCWEYQNEIRDDPSVYWDSLVVTEGQVTWIQEFDKSIKLTLTDASLVGVPFHDNGVTCWLPKSLKSLINFGRNSFAVIVARTNDGDYYDRDAKKNTGDKCLALNAFGIIGRPGLMSSVTEEGDSI